MPATKLNPFKEALGKLQSKAPVGVDLSSSQWADVPLALRERAMFSARTANAGYLQDIKDRVEKILNPQTVMREGRPVTEGMTVTSARTELKEILTGLNYDPGEKKGSLQDLSSDSRLNLVLKQNVESAQGYGQFLQGQAEGALDAFPAQELFRGEDRKEPRDWLQRWIQAGGATYPGGSDAELNNQRLIGLKTDPIWTQISAFGVPYPPFDFNSGMWVRDIARAEAEELGLLKPGEEVKPSVEAFNAELKASVRNLDPELQKSLKESFGDKVKIEKDAIWWKGDKAGKALAVDKKPRTVPAPKPAAPVEEPAPKSGEFPDKLSDLQSVKSLGGSTGAELVRDQAGNQFVRKAGASAAHLREEAAADALYRAMGVPVPEAKVYEEGKRPVKIARFIEGQTLDKYLKAATPEQREATLGKLREHFAADAVLGNWDVAGLTADNIVVDKAGTPWRIDNGGALRFRAQGTAKSADQWNAFPTELWSMRDATANPQTAKLFDKLSIYDIARQVQKMDTAAVLAAAPAEVKEVLAARIANLQAISRKALQYEATQFTAPYADQVTRHMMGLRKAGTLEHVADELKQGHAGDVRPVDKDGVAFDRLRTPKDAAKADPSQNYFDDLLNGVKTINGHHAKGDTSYNTGKLDKALGHKAALEKLLEKGSATEKEMAAHYLKFIGRIEEAKGKLGEKITQFTKFDAPVAKAAAKSRSAVSELADYIKANGGDWKIIEDWAGGQGGSSGSETSQALKYWLAQRLNVPASEFRNPPTKAVFDRVAARYGSDKYDRTFEMFHGFMQETLGKVSFEGNDQQAGLVRVLRTETTSGAVPFKKGATGEYQRGVNESGSIFAPVFGGTRTVTAVPHSRVTGLYMLERHPGNGHTFFLGDSENEVTYIGHGLKTLNLGSNASPNLAPGKDHTKWEL